MTINTLDWDSIFFNLAIAEAIGDESYLGAEFDLLISKNIEKKNLDYPHYLHTYSEVKVTYSKNLSEIKELKKDILDYDILPIEASRFYSLAYLSGEYSRFRLDSKIPKLKFEELYRLWIDNTINKKFGDKLLYLANNDGQLIGFVTLKFGIDEASVGLIAVDKDFQGMGFGKDLIYAAENICIKNNLLKINIPTQEENTLACNFYSKLGYTIKDKLTISHYWKKYDTI